MNDKIRQCCPNCSQTYHLKLQSSSAKGNWPLFLACGHSMCENCVKNIVKFLEPIECKICHQNMAIDASQVALLSKDKSKWYELFPINYLMLGELTAQYYENAESKPHNEDKEFFVDLHSILQEGGSKAVCVECRHATTKMCQQCATILCDSCFTKTHKNYVIFKNHVLKDIDEVTSPSVCKTHKDKPLDYYCVDCKKCICMDCFMVGGDKSCKNHNIVSMQEVNVGFLEELGQITPKVDETFRRLTKTAYDVGHMLYNIENETGSTSDLTQTVSKIEQHFSKLCSLVQKHKQEVVDIVTKLKSAEKESLYKAKNDLTNYIKMGKKVMDSIRMTANPKKVNEMNLAVLLEDAKQIAESPWFLTRDEGKKEPLKVAVNEDLCSLISGYVNLDGNVNSTYKLCKTSELGEGVEIPAAPPAPVFAPILPKDVREAKGKSKQKESKAREEVVQTGPTFFRNAPQYRSKSGSITSLNSGSSDSSQRSYKHQSKSNNAYIKPNVQPVQPFTETQQEKQLLEGSKELVYVSHIVNPHHFYVQRARHQSLVKDMLRHFRNGVSLPKPSLNSIVEGKIYLAFNKADNMWQRSRVVSVDKKNSIQPLFQVFCFDFGSTETVDIDKLRLMPPPMVASPQPLAIRCSLANCVPQTGAWTSDDSYLIHKIIDNKQVVINVRDIRQSANEGVTLECDVTTFEDGVSLAHALLFHERAKMPNPRLKYPQHIGMRERSKIFISNDDYKYKAVEEVCITHIVNPDKFYVRKRHQQTFYEELSMELEQEYSLAVNNGTIYLPEIGMSCCVHIPEQARGSGEVYTRAAGAWARAVVTGLPGRGRVALVLVDSGAPLLAHWSTLRHLHARFTKLSALATECHLAGVTPLNKRWSTGSLTFMQKFTDRFLELHVEDNRNRGSIGVTLIDHSDPDNTLCINQEMIKYKFAITFGIYSFNKNDDMADQVITNRSPLDKPVRHPKPKAEVQILKRNTPNEPQRIKASDLNAKDKGPLRIEAKVLQYQSPSLIYISLAHQQKTFNELFENMQKYYSKNKPSKKANWEVGDRCCAVCIQSQTWRRAVIVDLEGENAKLFYSDFATVETLPLASLAELTAEFASIGDAAIKCHLCGIMPAVGDEWPSLTKEYLKELLDCYRRLFITKLGNFKNKSMPVEIWAYHTIQGSALEPNKSEWRCLNKKIIEQGLGVPDKSEEVAYTEPKAEGGEEMLSFLNVTGSIHDWLQLEPMPTKPLTKLDSPTKSTTSTDQEEHDNAQDESSNVMFISDWLPPEPLINKEFTAMPTYIDHDGVIYLHDISQQGTLDLIRKALDVRFKDPDPKAKYQKWVVGEPCVALYFLDNRFYRGRVLEVNTETSTCTIHYIDYGNEEQCSFTNMRKSIALHQIPTQAHKCIFNRIRPCGEQWDRHTLDYIHKSIVEKQCEVKIVGDTVDGITPIELTIDKLWINDHLVEFDMAMYTDGSKAVVRKFAPVKGTEKITTASVTDSDPDYIVEDDSQDSFEVCSVKARDWNEMLNEDNSDAAESVYTTFPNDLEDEFHCNIVIIQDDKILDLEIVHDDNTALMYEEMSRDLQMEGENRPPINGIYENKACIALFNQDMQWYRASIMEYSESKGKVKVRYVDYGNIEVIDLADVREIHPEWAKMMPSSVAVKLHGVKLNPELDIKDVTQAYGETFLDKGPFIAKIIKKEEPYPIVELQNKNGELVYENLIAKGVFLKCESD